MYLVIFAPQFRLQAVLRHRPDFQRKPVALVERDDPSGLVVECSSQAAAYGIGKEMPVVQAMARCVSLQILHSAPKEEEAVQRILLEAALSLSPGVEATAPGCVTIDLRRSRPAAWERLGQDIVARLQPLALEVQIGAATNPDLAFLAAQKAAPVAILHEPQEFLAHLAVEDLAPSTELLAVLRSWGISTLGQLMAIPRHGLGDRLGPEADELWQRAAGTTSRPLKIVHPAEDFTEFFDFEREIETLEPLLFIIRRFLDHFAIRLGSIHRVVGRMELELPLEDGSAYRRLFSVPAPTLQTDVLFRILDTHLERLTLTSRPVACRLRVEPVAASNDQLGLFENALKDLNGFGETLARLEALVGLENVGVVTMHDTHRPDSFSLTFPQFGRAAAETKSQSAPPEIGLPLMRYRPAKAISVKTAQGVPRHLWSEEVQGLVQAAHGPYRVSGSWWDVEAWSLEEWDVELTTGGLYRISRSHRQWLLEGCYDASLY